MAAGNNRFNTPYSFLEFLSCTFAVSKAVSRIRTRLESERSRQRIIRNVDAYVKSMPEHSVERRYMRLDRDVTGFAARWLNRI